MRSMLAGACVVVLTLTTSAAADDAAEFLKEHLAVIRPLEYRVSLAWWYANTTGKDEDFKRKEEAQNALDAALADPSRFARLKAAAEAPSGDRMLTRQIHLLKLQYLEKQVDPTLLRKMSSVGNVIEKAFNAYRAKPGGVEMTDSKVRSILKESKDTGFRRNVWEAGKGVGPVVEKSLRELVGLRNESARKLGFKDFHVMMLALNEQEQSQVLKLFDELDVLTRTPFLKAKKEIDELLAASYGLPIDELRPWHYHDPFFQEPPAVYKTSLDAPYKTADILKLCSKFYAGIGLPVDDVLAHSDLYEKPGKSPHAFCTDINREGDVRVLANVVPNEYWMGTMLHELGHSVYSSKNIPASMPYVLRAESHILTTEGVAMMFERFSKSAAWLDKMGVRVADPAAFDAAAQRMRRNSLLIFSRWCQVMLRFEKELYGNPDQDLNKLWWDLVEKYQGLHRPEGRNQPDYASKIHIVSAPCYYHNYMMGELFACQVNAALVKHLQPNAVPSTAVYVDDPRVGQWMIEHVFAPGRALSWNYLTHHATGAWLSPKAFAEDFKE